MENASREVADAVLGEKKTGRLTVIHYARRTLNEAHMICATTEKVLLNLVFAFKKFPMYLFGYMAIIYIDHIAIRYLFENKESKSRLMR